jgi:hypothetical protein
MSITHHEEHETHEEKIKKFMEKSLRNKPRSGDYNVAPPLFKKVCLNLSECEE